MGGRSIASLSAAIADDLRAGRAVALGLEAPLAIPVPLGAADLSRGRENEGSRSWAAPFGLAVASLGLHQAAWLLADVRASLGETAAAVRFAHLAEDWPCPDPTLFCWEAFVSGAAHSGDHVRDAATAVHAFAAAEGDLRAASTVGAVRPLSLIVAAAMWSGWPCAADALRTQPAVIRPLFPYDGAILPAERGLVAG